MFLLRTIVVATVVIAIALFFIVFLEWLIIGSDRRSETKEGKIDRCRSCVRSPI